MAEKTSIDKSCLIDKREYRKRRKALFGRRNDLIQKILDAPFENKDSWGTIVEESTRKYPDNIAIKFEERSITYKDFNALVNRYTNYFLSLGLKKGDIVELLMTNRVELLIIFTAISKVGAICSLLNSTLQGKSLAYAINKTKGRLIIVGSELIDHFNKVKSQIDLVGYQKIFISPETNSITIPDGFLNLSQIINDYFSHNPSTVASVKTMDPIAYVFTSGTTGLPKAAVRTHYGMFGGAYTYGLLMTDMNPNDTVYIPLPFFHTTALSVAWPAAFSGGASVAIGRKFSVSKFWDEIRKYQATMFAYVGEMCSYLMNQPPSPNDKEHSIRAIIGNGLRIEIWKEFKERFNIEFIGEFYGQSEVPAVFINLLNFDCTLGMCSSPFAIAKFDFEEEKPIRNNDGFMERVDLGEVGLLLFESKGSTEFPGYVSKEATKAKLLNNVFVDGDIWINTGDLLRDQGCNHAQFFDRLGDTFRWKGHNVSTTEVEKILNSFKDITISCVYGVKIPGASGRAGMASIIAAEPIEDFDFKELYDYLDENLPTYAIPIFLRFTSSLETTPTLKLKKFRLKKEGYDLTSIEDPIYNRLPNSSNYNRLTKNVYIKIQNQTLQF